MSMQLLTGVHRIAIAVDSRASKEGVGCAGQLYARPPQVVVATAIQRCTRGDWLEDEQQWSDHLSWMSLWNKVDFARLHGTAFHFFAVPVSALPPPALECLNMSSG